jgi:tRNA A-37 threonylcarbamoyl transferase component Bud32
MSSGDLNIGRVFNQTYKVEQLIGEGSMGTVYVVSHTRVKRRFALKLLKSELASASPEALTRFQREAEITSGLGHPNIVEVLDFNRTADGAHYLVMELLDGQNLTSLIDRPQPVGLEEALTILRQAASGLQAAHEGGVVHRDLKPSNLVLCDYAGRQGVVKILDFGISKVLGHESSLTATTAVMGTPFYMSPEQADGRSAEVDARSDIFSLGAIAYHLISGQLPFPGHSVPAVLFKVAYEAPPPLQSLRLDVPMSLQAAIEKAMSKDPGQRYPTMNAFIAALVDASEDTVAEVPVRAGVAAASASLAGGAPVAEDEPLAGTLGDTMGEVLPGRPHGTRTYAVIGAAMLLVFGVVVMIIALYPDSPTGSTSSASPPSDGQRVQTARNEPDAALRGSPVTASLPPDARTLASASARQDSGHDQSTGRRATRKEVKLRRTRPLMSGSVTITTYDRGEEPLTARVYLNGGYVGESPITFSVARNRAHRIRLQAPGFRTVHRRIKLRRREVTLPFRLDPTGNNK